MTFEISLNDELSLFVGELSKRMGVDASQIIGRLLLSEVERLHAAAAVYGFSDPHAAILPLIRTAEGKLLSEEHLKVLFFRKHFIEFAELKAAKALAEAVSTLLTTEQGTRGAA